MTYSLSFSFLHRYSVSVQGITIPVELRHGDRTVVLNAKLDTGASFCIFQRVYGEALGFDIERGAPEWIATPTGNFLAYGHELTLSTLDFQLDTLVYFARDEDFRRNVLGRRGWLDQIRIAIIDYDGEVYTSRYDEA